MSTSDSRPVSPQHAWREIPRVETPKRPVAERVADFLEIYTTLDEETAREQAIRCVQCPHPTCVEACPLGNNIPDWLALTAEGHFLEAAQLLQTSGCMGEVFSRLCTDPCEAQCVVAGHGEPVAINAVERFLHHYALEHPAPQGARPVPNGLRVAVMDSGPCGLACAHDLARQGYAVTVFDHHLLPGGLLVNGVPAFKVERTVVRRRIEHLETLGVTFRLGVHGGADVQLRELQAQFDAIFFGACAEEARPLTVPGADLKSVYQALTYLIQQNLEGSLDLEPISVAGRRVVVLGAGDTAMDCLRTARRAGARDTLCLYRRDEASLPADRAEYANAREEGAQFEFLAEPVALLGDASGHVRAVQCRRLSPAAGTEPDRVELVPVPGSEFEVPADVVFVAYGYSAAPFCTAGDYARIPLDAEGRIVVDEHLMTAIPGVFAGGSLVHGRTPAVETVRDARRAARAIHGYLSGRRGHTSPVGAGKD